MHISHKHTHSWLPLLSNRVGVEGVWIGDGVERAVGERTWSRAWGQRADERGFTIRQECILFIFSRTRLTRQGTDRQTARERGEEEEGEIQLLETHLSSAEVNVFPSPGSLVYDVFFTPLQSLSPNTHPTSCSQSPEV